VLATRTGMFIAVLMSASRVPGSASQLAVTGCGL
jgi:hypothetical protein